MENLKTFDSILTKNHFPINVYGLRLQNSITKEVIEIMIEHDGYCPLISTEREQSRFNDYLSNLEYVVTENYCIENKINSNNLVVLMELMTNDKGEIYHCSK